MLNFVLRHMSWKLWQPVTNSEDRAIMSLTTTGLFKGTS